MSVFERHDFSRTWLFLLESLESLESLPIDLRYHVFYN